MHDHGVNLSAGHGLIVASHIKVGAVQGFGNLIGGHAAIGGCKGHYYGFFNGHGTKVMIFRKKLVPTNIDLILLF